jgi:hypothetical protein
VVAEAHLAMVCCGAPRPTRAARVPRDHLPVSESGHEGNLAVALATRLRTVARSGVPMSP